jgi:hypothetical protein
MSPVAALVGFALLGTGAAQSPAPSGAPRQEPVRGLPLGQPLGQPLDQPLDQPQGQPQGTTTPGQSPAPAPPDVEELAVLVETAHRTAAARPVTAFRTDLRIQELARAAEQHRGELELSVAFLEWKQPDGRAWPLIRYKQSDSARAVEQGRDGENYWTVQDGVVHDMGARQFETDLANARRNLKLARQMIQFLDPATVLRRLEQPSAVGETELVLGKKQIGTCHTVSGRLPAFPMRQQSGDDVPVAATVHFARDTHWLTALEVRPLQDGKPAATGGEFLLFSEHRVIAGRLVPMRIVHFAIEPDGQRRTQLRIDITRLELDAELQPRDFDRPRK